MLFFSLILQGPCIVFQRWSLPLTWLILRPWSSCWSFSVDLIRALFDLVWLVVYGFSGLRKAGNPQLTRVMLVNCVQGHNQYNWGRVGGGSLYLDKEAWGGGIASTIVHPTNRLINRRQRGGIDFHSLKDREKIIYLIEMLGIYQATPLTGIYSIVFSFNKLPI